MHPCGSHRVMEAERVGRVMSSPWFATAFAAKKLPFISVCEPLAIMA